MKGETGSSQSRAVSSVTDSLAVKGTGASIDVFVADWRGDAGGFDMDFDYMSSKMAEAGGGPIASGFDVDWEFSEPMLSAPRKP